MSRWSRLNNAKFPDADFGDLAVRFEIETLGVVRAALKPVPKDASNIRVVAALGLDAK